MSQEISGQQPLILNLVLSQAFKAEMFSALSAVFLLGPGFRLFVVWLVHYLAVYSVWSLIKQTLMATTRSSNGSVSVRH